MGISWSADGNIGVSLGELRDIVECVNKFGFKALPLLASGKENFVFSPVSCYVVLCMCPSLFPSFVRDELLRGLCLDVSESDESFGRRLCGFLKYESSPCVCPYNRVFINKNLELPENLFDVLLNDVQVPAVRTAFPQPGCDQVNKGVCEATHGMIKEILNEGAVTVNTICVLVNAIYFKSEWVHKFDGKSRLLWHNNDGTFRDMEGMTVENVRVPYLCRDGYQIVKLPYKGGYSMVIFLPPKWDKVAVPDVSFEFFRDNIPRKKCKVDFICMPEWSNETDALDFIPVCKHLGIHKLFDRSKEFYVSTLVQKANITVDRDGTTAAAVTAAVDMTRSPFARVPINFVVDHPFFYAIVNDKTEVIEFMGYLASPA